MVHGDWFCNTGRRHHPVPLSSLNWLRIMCYPQAAYTRFYSPSNLHRWFPPSLIADNYQLDLRPSLGVLSPNQMILCSHFKIAISVMTHYTVSSLASALYNISLLGFRLSKAIWDELSVYENKLRHVRRTELPVAFFSHFFVPWSCFLLFGWKQGPHWCGIFTSRSPGQGWQRILNPCKQQSEDPLNWRWRPEILHGVEQGPCRRPKPSTQLSK